MSIYRPCELPCPKCGSADVYREFYAKGDRIETEKYNKPPGASGWYSGNGWDWQAIREVIAHHCRCCQYDWVTKPLKKANKCAPTT